MPACFHAWCTCTGLLCSTVLSDPQQKEQRARGKKKKSETQRTNKATTRESNELNKKAKQSSTP